MAEYTKIETARSIICDMCECLYPDGYCPEKCDLEKCDWMEHLKEDAADVEKISDGYHTFADLYEQRLILSAALAKNNPHAWKSKRHEDGSVPFGGGWFIMGFDTDEGCYTYHYELKDWDLFQCEELDKGKPWDGHTSKDVRRLLSIPAADVAPVPQWISVDDRLPELDTDQVLVLDENGNIYNTWYDGCIDDRCRFGHYRAVYNSDTLGFDGVDWVPDEGVTHWMPMPVPPKGE